MIQLILNWAEDDNAFNGDYIDTSSYTQCLITGNFTADDNATIKFKMPQLTGVADAISIPFSFFWECSIIINIW